VVRKDRWRLDPRTLADGEVTLLATALAAALEPSE
jgi:hypothetical protein